MAKHNGTAALLMIASLLVAVNLTEARLTVHHNELFGGSMVADAAAPPALSCHKVHGVRAGETCFSMAVLEGLKLEQFLAINPNINCKKVFVGQWVCLAATSA